MECIYRGCDCFYCKRKTFVKNSACKYAKKKCFKKTLDIKDLIHCDKAIHGEDKRLWITKKYHSLLGFAREKIARIQVRLYLKKGKFKDRILYKPKRWS